MGLTWFVIRLAAIVTFNNHAKVFQLKKSITYRMCKRGDWWIFQHSCRDLPQKRLQKKF